MKPYEPLDDVPSLGISPHDIQAIHTIVTSYLVYLRKGAVPAKKRGNEIALLESLQKRVLATVPTEGGIIPLTAEEIQALANAMQGFAKLTRQIVPQSEERDDLLKEIAAVREHLLHMLTGRNN